MVAALNEIGMVRTPVQAPSQSPSKQNQVSNPLNFGGSQRMSPLNETSGSVANNPIGTSPIPQGPLGENAINCNGGKLGGNLNIIA